MNRLSYTVKCQRFYQESINQGYWGVSGVSVYHGQTLLLTLEI